MFRTGVYGVSVVIFLLSGCEATYHAKQVQSANDSNSLTVGTVQKEIAVGMSSAAVAEKLGSPNIVSTDDQGREVWVYDKMATDIVTSGSSWFVTAGASSRTQRTLTIVIKYDKQSKVRDIAYHSTKF